MKKTISVAVITYNSANTVTETLDSIYSQTYGAENIELIISDDASPDNTVAVIHDWLTLHESSFNRVVFFENKKNGGVSKNINVAWTASTSEWIKTIAGDDILLPNCLDDNIDYVLEKGNHEVGAVFSLMQVFYVDEQSNKINSHLMPSSAYHHFFDLTSEAQYDYLKINGIPIAPSSFIKRSALISVGYADERFRLIEDYPLWLKLTKHGYTLRFFKKTTVQYRKSDSISSSRSKIINEHYFNEIALIDDIVVIPDLKKSQYILKLRKKAWPKAMVYVARIFNNTPNAISNIIVGLINFLKPGFISLQLRKFKIYIGC